MDIAGLSLTDPAGLFPSSFDRMTFDRCTPSAAGMRCSLVSGVPPTKDSMPGVMVDKTGLEIEGLVCWTSIMRSFPLFEI
jgi:hypothetical protein